MTTMLGILQHALGRDEYGKPRHGSEDYRNHYCVGDGPDLTTCREAVALGLMTEHAPRAISGGDFIFTVTPAGKAYIAEHSPAPPKLTRGQERYRKWLDVRDVYDLSFGEWLIAGGEVIARSLRAIADALDPQRGLPPSQGAYVADLNEARAEGRRDALRDLSAWLAPLATEAARGADTGARSAWDSRYCAFVAVIEYCRRKSL